MPGNASLVYDPMGVIIFLIGLSLTPFIAMMVTSYMKLVIVMNLLRQAMGLQQVPPNMVINGLAVIMTLYIMAPTLQETIHRIMRANTMLEVRKTDKAAFELPSDVKKFAENKSNDNQWFSAFSKDSSTEEKSIQDLSAILGYTKQPMVDFLMRHSTSKHRSFFMHIARRIWPKPYLEDLKSSDLIICVPAFILTELTAAFEIGFIIYLPFITIDLVISNVLLAMGMMMVSPMTISLPFKLMLFVLVSGWDKLVEALALTYR